MELLILSFCLVTFSLFLAFLNGIFSEAVAEDIEKEIKELPKKFFSIFYNKNLVSSSFLFFEILFYLLSFHFISIYFAFLYVLFNSYFFIVLIILTFFVFVSRTVLFFVGARFSKRLFPLFYKLIYWLFILFRFSGVFYQWLKNTITSSNQEATLEDIQEVVETAHDEGKIQTGEYKIFTNVIKFNQVPVSDVMTPRTVIFACSADLTVEEAIKLPEIKIYSRFPIYEGNSLDDKVIGYVVAKDIFQAALNNKLETKLREFARDIYFIPENVTLDDALNQFLSKRQHIFLVVDEFGGIEGLVTMEDLIETILGEEIIDEADKYIDLREVAKRKREHRLKLTQDNQQSSGQINQ
ncbi:MAG: CBS domain-containing protein [Ignavibacteria bacterium]|nr:CBS domain-containing protein [Ignavibacteria bacterium]